jgi:hypothetical protein
LPPKLGRYELITRIGEGGMAEVQLALQRGPAGFEKLVVVKLVHENLASQKPFVDMLLDEARVAALVKHPNVVDIYDLGEANGRYFIAMEYLEGEPLLAVLRAGRDGQRLDVLSTARLIADTAEGLDAAHELRSIAGDPIELVHHDISLGNIVVLYNGQVKLVDFGVAKATQSATARAKVQGKFGYMAPEKLRGGRGDRRSDIWSLGCVLWEALTLRRLFRGGNDGDTMQQVLDIPILAPSKVNGDVPADFDPIALRALQRDPSKRYPTAKAMAAEIEEVLRKHGYAAKNDMIARYMQATFADRIAARKKVLQEVSSKGRPSQDALEAAFNLGALASGSPVLAASDPWSRRLRVDDAPAERPAIRAIGGLGDGSGARGAMNAAPHAPAAADPAPRAPAPPAAAAGTPAPAAIEGPTGVERSAATAHRRWIPYAAGAAAVIAILVVAGVLVARGRGSAQERSRLFEAAPEASTAPTAASDDPPPAAADPPPSVEARAQPAQGGEHMPIAAAAPARDDDITLEPSTAKPSHPRHPQAIRPTQAARPAPDKVNPEETVKEALQALVRGDTRTALALCKRVTQSNPGHAAAWRVMGLVYEKLGDKTNARGAFQRYLQLAPTAPDAPSIRQHLEAL